MINVFERLAPIYSRVLRKFALDVWYNRADRGEFYESAERYKRRYENELMKHYRSVGYPFRPDEIRKMGDEWLKDQITLADKVRSISDEKKDGLSDELDKLVEEKRREVGNLLSGVQKPEGRVVSVISFSHNFEAKALQMGEDAAFDLAREINHAVVSGMSDVYRWTSQEDNRVRKTHRILNGKLFSYNDPPTTEDEYGHKHTGNPGTDWGCVPSGTRIRLNSDIVRCFRRRYSGELTTIITESGITLSATGNHPVLTQSGWKPANLIQTGDYVFKVPDKRIQRRETDIYDTGVPVEKVFDFFSLCGGTESVPGSASQFHGDGIPDEKVDVVTVDWVLTDERDAIYGQKIRKLIFSDANVVPFHLLGSSQCQLDSAFFWLGLSSFGNVRRLSELHSLFGSGVLKADDVCLTSIARSEPSISDDATNKRPHVDIPKMLDRTSQSTHSRCIIIDDLVFERVVRIENRSFDGHVYNLQTSTNWYIANGLSIHNCRCYEVPAKGRPLKSYTARA